MKHKFHLYEKINIAKAPKEHYVFQCMLPGCSHYQHASVFLNKEGLCWDCRAPFLITKDLITKKPICLDCIKAKKEAEAARILNEINKFIVGKI